MVDKPLVAGVSVMAQYSTVQQKSKHPLEVRKIDRNQLLAVVPEKILIL
jgi:hypothetical protein